MAENGDVTIDLTQTDDSEMEDSDKFSSNSPSCSGNTVATSTSDTTSGVKKKVMKRKITGNIEEKSKEKKTAEEEQQAIKKSKMKKAAVEEQHAIEKSKMKKAAEEKQQRIEKSKMKKAVEEEQHAKEKSKMKKVAEEDQQAAKKSKKKTAAEEEQEAKKQRKLDEQEARRERREAIEQLKVYKPGECMKYMTLEIHPALSEAWYMADVPREAAAAGCKVSVQASVCDPSLIMWTRTLQPTLTADNGQLGLLTKERCEHALYVSEASAVAELVRDLKLADHVTQVRDLAACPLTLIIFGANDYFKSNRKTNNSNRKKITEIELQMALSDLIVSTGCDGVMAETANDLALMIMQYTKAIAEAPYKLAKRSIDEQEEFYMRGDKKDSMELDINGNGVIRLWQQMIAVLPHSSLEKARALCDKYKTPLQLCEALNKPNSIHELSYLVVSRSNEPNARGRRLGPKFAKKLHTLFTAEDGNVVLD